MAKKQDKKKLEIERKFLLKRLPLLIHVEEPALDQMWIRQYYSPEGRYRCEYRPEGSTYILCVKTDPDPADQSKVATVKIEDETVISYNDFRAGIKNADRFLTKKRFAFYIGEAKWDIDVYDNMQLVTAEAEMPTADFALEIPEFIQAEIIMEVTGVKAFTNWSLAEPGTMNVTKSIIEDTLEEIKNASLGLIRSGFSLLHIGNKIKS